MSVARSERYGSSSPRGVRSLTERLLDPEQREHQPVFSSEPEHKSAVVGARGQGVGGVSCVEGREHFRVVLSVLAEQGGGIEVGT
ncbi:hypothetical protein BE21_43000 [Sorangium cellulosum]|uniref:Uncharacterized protein n=1 Tax=Sorangium cellulosum TaxID=56 RepID=A0A150TK69_SORCE|nr:hypothetical protein BE21_43000 [Sorangium cellulosum]